MQNCSQFYLSRWGWCYPATAPFTSPALDGAFQCWGTPILCLVTQGSLNSGNSGHTWAAVSKVTYWLHSSLRYDVHLLLSPRERLNFLHLCCKLPWRFSVNKWSSAMTRENEYPKYIRKSFLQIIRSTLFNQGFCCNAGQSYAIRRWWYQTAIPMTWARNTSWMTGWTFIRCGICTFSSKMNQSGLI